MYSPDISSNNPFIIDHSLGDASERYPDITGSESAASGSQYTSWLKGPASTATSPYPTNQAKIQGNGYQPSPQPTGQWGKGSGFVPPQHTASFSPPLVPAPQMSGMPFLEQQPAYGTYHGTSQQPLPQYTGQQPQHGLRQDYQYPGQQLSYHSGPQYLSEFDPYAARAAQPHGTPTPVAQSGAAPSGYKALHPRQYIQSHKTELEQWDSYTWKQAQNCFVELKQAWEARKNAIESQLKALGGAGLFGAGGYAYGGGAAQQYAQLESMAKEAGHNVDSIAASIFQMDEVFSGYRQSSDIASKRRVREAINAALTNLSDWP